ncbi:hypothetical protein N0V93_005588 [Gnomoniopsis smithogilvyi]|uniref:Guanine nucleotide-exchange factor SEC12 n=1 Tax=Gnomoniopsis smithogilvyi TaxID=1191159 RepID=A0A9W9CXA0_9PEZI|nr:hypothetical protein N0V93_005588 [Gnomoniopsis smithogilvyi]
MAPPFPETKITLDYPLYGCDFDPQDPNRLFVAGGGGASRTGVGNKITLLDATSREKLQVAGEITLSKNEDNPTNLVAGQRKGKATLLYAGINSSVDDIDKGNNAHFRVFGAEQAPSKAKSILGARISELSRSTLFSSQDKDAYQRLLRVTQPFAGAAQFGAVATGLAKESQIALFEVAAGNNAAPRSMGVLDLSKEAADLDVVQTDKGKFQLMYCDNHNIYTLDVAETSTTGEPKSIYTMPDDDAKPSFRCIRYLSPKFAIAVANLPSPGGVVLYGFRLPKAGREDGVARIAVNTKLPKRKGAKATGLAIANLSPISTLGATQGDTQFVIAVANNDFSIHLYSLDHRIMGDVDLLANLHPLQVLKEVHPAMITNLCFSHFSPPKAPTARTQYLKLASTSVSNSVVVQSIPLKKFTDRSGKVRRGGPPRQPRYVTALQATSPSPTSMLLFFAAVALIFSILVQGVLEVRGLAQPTVGGHKWLPSSIHAVPATRPAPHAGFLARLLEGSNMAQHKDGIVLLDSEIPGELKVDTTHDGSARSWEELAPQQQTLWKQRLQKSGHWAEDMGTVVFKGILFGELAGAVGAMVGG